MKEHLQRKRSLLTLFLLSLMVLTAPAFGQQTALNGIVRDEAGEVLPGVSVFVKGTTNGTVTDTNGAYSIDVSNDAILVFSFVGFKTQEIAVDGRSSIDLTLPSDVTALNEIVIVGYGEQEKSLVTGAISSVDSEQLQTVSVSRVDQALQGRTSGVAITPTSGSPGSGTKIRIRGASSNGSSDPLVIIDGVRTNTSGLDFLSPNDIESMEILKDAASAAIYGAEGANGVLIITTKSGKAGAPQISYSGQIGRQTVNPNLMEVMNPSQYQQYLEEANVSTRPTDEEVAAAQGGINWLDQVFKPAMQQNHSLNFSGGTDKSNFFISTNYFTQEGIVGGDKSQFKRYTIRINASHEIKKWLRIGENLAYSNFTRTGVPEDDSFRSVVNSAVGFDPLTPVVYNGALPAHVTALAPADQALLAKDPAGRYYGVSQYVFGEYSNPQRMIDHENRRTRQNKVLGNVYAEFQILKELQFTTRFGIDAAFQREHNWSPISFSNYQNKASVSSGSDNLDEWFTWQWENFASYTKKVDNHSLTLLGGFSQQLYTYNEVRSSYSGLFLESDDFSYGAYVSDEFDRISTRPEYRALRSYFGRLSYDFQGKYLFEATVRRDGSSMLAKENQWGTFPSLSAGWVLSNEGFFPTSLPISFIKVRGSWGRNGSLSNLVPDQWQSSISPNEGNRLIKYADANNNFVFGAAPTQLANPNLTWETSEQIDLGLDMRFINDRLGLMVDYYNKKTKDLITAGNPPGFSGLGLPFVNAGEVSNKGVEIEVSYKSQPTSALTWEVSANFTTLKNRVTELSEGVQPPNGTSVTNDWFNATAFKEGEPIWYFNGFKTNGIFQRQEDVDAYNEKYSQNVQLGDPVIVDVTNDNIISTNDYTKIGSPHPEAFYGARIALGYKGFDFIAFVQGQYGNDVLMGFVRSDYSSSNKPLFFLEDRWTPDNPTNDWFRATASGRTYQSDFMIADGSYARIRQLQLGYSLPAIITDRLHVKNFRVYVSLDNYFTFTKYKGIDPEAGSTRNNSIGIDRGVYPIPRTLLGGLSFTF